MDCLIKDLPSLLWWSVDRRVTSLEMRDIIDCQVACKAVNFIEMFS